MSNDEVGLYIRLLAMQWGRGYVTEDDAARLGKGMAEPSLCYVKSKFKVGDDGNLRNGRLEAERAKQTEFRESRANAGKAGANKRWHDGTAIAQPSQTDSTAIILPITNDGSPSPSPSSSPNNKKDKGSLEQVESYFEELKLPKSDAVWFFNKCEGNGWTNGGKPIKDWKATIRSWQSAGYLPSQKAKPFTQMQPSRNSIQSGSVPAHRGGNF